MRRALAGLLLVSACTSAAGATRHPATVTVFAAASLSKAFAAEASAYERTHPGTHVTFSFAGSQTLVAQVEQGAPADVIATADVATILAVDSRLRTPYAVFAHNQLAIVTAPGNPRHLQRLADLAAAGLRVVLAGPTVPVGKAADRALARAHVVLRPVSLEDAVTGVVTKVRLGEADAGIAYVTDVGDGVAGVPVPHTTTDLAIGELTAAGASFAGFVTSAQGQAILRSFGFT